MNILVFGAGTVGCYVGAHLVLSGHHVTLVTRPDSA
ncbi:MAG: 2-dehydropantoate 2-reductase, partial [Methylococcales bacterium]|nr:2-dehydropantoate 2-reductase [Methylococcales bacterium]